MSKFDREPIFWTTTQSGYNTTDRERVSMQRGKRVVEKVPQIGHQGDYEDKVPARGQRYIDVVRHDGHVVPLLLTNAAAHMDPNTGWATYQKRKAKFLGWLPAGGCPAALLLSGEITVDHLAEQSIVGEPPCSGTHSKRNPCPHMVRELAARRANNKAHNDERMASFKSDSDRLIEEQRNATKDMIEGVASILLESRRRETELPGPEDLPPRPDDPEPTDGDLGDEPTGEHANEPKRRGRGKQGQ